MNIYGRRAKEYWARVAPSRYAQLEDPQWYFSDLGEQVETMVERIRSSLESRLPPDLDYLNRLGQLQAIRMQAEEVAMNDLVYVVDPEPANPQEELDQMLGDLPPQFQIDLAIIGIWEQIQADAELTGSPELIPDAAQQEMLDWLEALRPLVDDSTDPWEMSPQDLDERINALRPFHAKFINEHL